MASHLDLSVRLTRSSLAHQPSLWPQDHATASVAPSRPLHTRADTQPPADDAPAAAPRVRTPSFVCEVPLRVSPAEERVLQARLEAARALYNACLGEARRRWRLVEESKAYQHAQRLPKKTTERKDAFKAARAAHGFTDADLQAYAKECRHASVWIEDHLDAPVSQKLATRAYRAVNRIAVGHAEGVRFKGKNQLDSVEGKSNLTGLVWRSDRVVWKGLTLRVAVPPRLRKEPQHDPVLAHGLAAPVKYVRLVRRRMKGKPRFWVQLICKGTPYQKPAHPLGEGIVGLDLGPSTVAVVSESAARLQPFCAELDVEAAVIRREQRHLDRQRRANNPDNYEPDGCVKKGRKGRKYWKESHRQRRTQARLANRRRRQAAHRKSLHGRLAHQVLRQGNAFLLEQVSYKAWQRRYGRSIQRRAPGMFVQILTRLAESAGGQMHLIPTRPTKLSQRCQCGAEKKKPLSQRVHACEVCGLQMQRDLYSAYLIRFVDPETYLLHAGQACEAWPGAESLLRAAWQQALPTSQPASGKAYCPIHVRRRHTARRRSRSSAVGHPAKFKNLDAVPSGRAR
jgi:putative transposase